MRHLAVLVVLGAILAGCMAGGTPSPQASLDAPEGSTPSSNPSAAGGTDSRTSATSRSTTTSSSAQSTSTSAPSGPSSPQGGPHNATNATREPQPFEPESPEGSGDCNGLTPRYVGAPPAGLAQGWDLLRLDLAVLADPTFAAAHPDDWESLLRDLVADASVHYEEQLGLRLVATIVDRLPDGSLSPDPAVAAGPTAVVAGQNDMRAAARGFMHANHPDAVVDATAIILGADYSGTVAGQVECVGGAADPEYSYLWAEYKEPRDAQTWVADPLGYKDDNALRVFMHELGHLLDAHHHYSNCGEAVVEYRSSNFLGVCDVMINDIGLASFRFGPTNRFVMRSFVEAAGIGEPVP